MVDASHDKEIRAKETISQLKTEIAHLSQLVEEGAGLSSGQENAVKELMKVKEDLTAKLNDTQKNNEELVSRIQELHAQLDEKKNSSQELMDTINELREELANSKAREAREAKHKERLDKELKNMRVQLEAKATERDQLMATLQQKEKKIEDTQKELDQVRATLDKTLRDYSTLQNKSDQVQAENEENIKKNAALQAENKCLMATIEDKSSDIKKLESNIEQLRRQVDAGKKREKNLENVLGENKLQQEMLKNDIKTLNNQVEKSKERETIIERQLQTIERERDHTRTSLEQQQQRTKAEENKAMEKERTVQGLEMDLEKFKREVGLLEKEIARLTREKESFGIELSQEHNRYLDMLEQLKLKEMAEADLLKKIAEGEAKLKQQQQLYEAVRSDRNLYSKNLIEAQDEIAELKRKFKIMTHQIEQLKEEIAAKDQALVREHFDRQKTEKNYEHEKQELAKRNALLIESEKTLEKQHQEIGKLTRCIASMDEDALRQRKEYDQIINERDILGTQLIRRNDELALLYEKLKILKSTLTKGEYQYNERLEDIKALRLKIADDEREMAIIRRRAGQLGDMKDEIFQLQRELLQEKTKVKALSEELENPMNVHRWRKLEGSDPATYEMIQKIQTLQKRLIHKTEQVVEKDLVIKEKDKIYDELKGILARQPGPEVAEQLNAYQHNLKEKTKQMKVLAAELNMSQAQVNEYKYEIEKLNCDLQDLKRRYYDSKKLVETLKLDLSQMTGQATGTVQRAITQATSAANSQARYTGGGFCLSMGKK